VVLVSNGGLRPSAYPGAEVVVVPEGPDVADKWIADRVTPGDVCVTTDLPLAARVHRRGRPRREAQRRGADRAQHRPPRIASRDLAADLRAADPFRQAGGAPSRMPTARASSTRSTG
jgi:uncharacterized protein YaiI (UPF0178 family)